MRVMSLALASLAAALREHQDTAGSQIWFGRLLVMPVDSMLCACVICSGIPERRYTMPLTCQPPHTLLAPQGSS